MGVLNTQDREKRSVLLPNCLSGDDTLPVDEDADSLPAPRLTQLRYPKTSSRSSRAPRPQSHIKNTGRRARGSRNSRKYENSIFLSEIIDCDEFGELNIADFMVKSVSGFGMLFEDESQMNKWSAFVSMKGEEQEKYLRELACVSVRKCSSKPEDLSGNKESVAAALHYSPLDNIGGCGNSFYEKVHYYHLLAVPETFLLVTVDRQQAARCFQKVDNRIKTALKNRNISLDGLKFFEEEVVSFFNVVDKAVLVSLIHSSMDRLLVHGICQYLNLKSSSNPGHVVEIENLKNQFQPPAMLLSQYLQHIR